MTDKVLLDQAAELISLLPRIGRRISTLGENDPATDLPVAQLRVCSILMDGPRTMCALSRELGISQSAITQLADRLERAGLVERMIEEEDRRTKCLRLTLHGSEVMNARNRIRTQNALRALSEMPAESRVEALRALQMLLDACLASAKSEPDQASGVGETA